MQCPNWILVTQMITLIGGAALIAWRNYRRGRGDLLGAFRLAAFGFVARMARWALLAHHVASVAEVTKLAWALADALLVGAVLWVFYVALEPETCGEHPDWRPLRSSRGWRGGRPASQTSTDDRR